MINLTPSKKTGLRFFVIFLAIYIFLLPINTGLAGILGDISAVNYIWVLCILFMMYSLFKQGYYRLHKKMLYAYTYIFYMLLTVVWSNNYRFDWYFFTSLSNFLLIVFGCGIVYTNYEYIFLKGAIYCSIIPILLATFFNIDSALAGRLHIILFSPIDINDFAYGTCLLIALFLYNIFFENNNSKWLYWLGLSLLFSLIVMTGSRGAILMFFVMFGFTMRKAGIFNFRTVINALILFTILYFAFLYLMSINEISNEVLNRLNIMNALDTGGSGRLGIWRDALNYYFNASFLPMIFGCGYGDFANAVQYNYYGIYLMSHNSYLQALIECGFIGLCLMVLAFYETLRNTILTKHIFSELALIGIFVSCCFIDMQITRLYGIVFLFAGMQVKD